MKHKLYQQFVLLKKASVAHSRAKNIEDIRALLVDAIKIGIPVFKEEDIKKYLLTKQDIEMINLMAILHHDEGRLDKAIDLMYNLKANYDNRFMEAISKGRHYPMVIYNITKYLGMAGRYKEAIKLCDVGAEICREIRAFGLLPLIVFNKAACLVELGDKETSEKLFRQAYHASIMYEDFTKAELIKNYASEKLGAVL
jgi:tetratricopeptide (TPR) repeat protein